MNDPNDPNDPNPVTDVNGINEVNGLDARWSAEFPNLFRDEYVGYANAHTRFTTAPVPDPLVSRLHLVAVTANADVVVCRSDRGWRFLPGGTREPGETLDELARRELLEEAGAELIGSPRYFATHIADHAGDAPYRAHLPYPRAYWAYAVADVQVIGPPTNPPDGERVVEVVALPPSEAVRFIARNDRTHADILRLAIAMNLLPTPKIHDDHGIPHDHGIPLDHDSLPSTEPHTPRTSS